MSHLAWIRRFSTAARRHKGALAALRPLDVRPACLRGRRLAIAPVWHRSLRRQSTDPGSTGAGWLTERSRSRAVVDLVVAVLAAAATVAQLSHGGVATSAAGEQDLGLSGTLLAVGSALPLVVASRFPVVVFVITGALSALVVGLGHPLDMLVAPAYALYRVAAGRTRAGGWTGGLTILVVGVLAAYLVAAGVAAESIPGVPLIHTGLVSAGAWFAGERSRLRHEQIDELRERARAAEREAERERLLAVAEERTRIARELHDSAGHAISVIAVRAGGARLRHGTDPDAALPALTAIEELARSTGEEIDQIVRSLRDGGPEDPAEAPPGLSSLDTLVARHAAAGLTVSVERSGETRRLGAVADRAAYRILQEAMTNAARHGAGRATLSLAYGDDLLEIIATNPIASQPARNGGGHGLVGMRERAAMLGGSLEAVQAGGRFRLTARIPYGAMQ